MAYRNQKRLAWLPAILLLLASHPLAIHSHNLDVWLSPVHGSSLALHAQLPVNSLIFTQYLATLAVIEACREKSVLGPKAGTNMKIKWPTNVYIINKNGNGKKVGSVLVTKSDRAEGADLIIGEQTIMPLLIKWPTNVYIIDKNRNRKKVGGVFMTKSDCAEGADLIIGEQTIMPLLINSFAPLCILISRHVFRMARATFWS
jgi:biotin-(acetyl-CoA carboxylase) ligase